MPIPPPSLQAFWNDCLQAAPRLDAARYYDVCVFGDDEQMARELADLVLSGTKRGTAGSLAYYQDQGIRMPRPGDLSIVTDWAGVPQCVIETRTVQVVPMDEVGAEFAAIEGEGDGSLAWWRDAHRRYFERECQRAGRPFDEKMLLACETFEVVFAPGVYPSGTSALT